MGCSPCGGEEYTTKQLHFHFSVSCIGEGNGTPLQCSCLENPRDGRAWWAAVYGVAQSQTQLKRLSSSSRAITPAAEIVRVPAHLASPRSPQPQHLHHPQASPGQSCHRQKRLASVHVESLRVCPIFVILWTVVCQASLSGGVLQARTLECIGQYWLPYLCRALYFLLPSCQLPWCFQNPCDPSSCITSTPGPHWDKPKSSRAAAGANPSERPT